MSGRQPDEPYHRQWLHALEDETTVPSREMQLARVYADYAPASGGRATRVAARTMRKHTHMSFGAITAGNEWLVEHGWLVPHGENGQRKTYDLTFGRGGAKRKPFRQPERSAGGNRSDGRNGHRAEDRSDSRNATVPAAGAVPFRLPEREQKEQKEQKRDLSARAKVARRVRQVRPDATEREIDLFIAQIEAERSPDRIDRYVASYPDPTIAEKIEAIKNNGTAPKHANGSTAPVSTGGTPTPVPPKFTAPAPAAPPRQESIEAARAAIAHLRRAPSVASDPLRDLAAAQAGEARAARATPQPESA